MGFSRVCHLTGLIETFRLQHLTRGAEGGRPQPINSRADAVLRLGDTLRKANNGGRPENRRDHRLLSAFPAGLPMTRKCGMVPA